MEIPELGVKSELQLPAYLTTMATPIFNPRSKAKDRAHILKDTMLGS